jgi:hypothetical protein
MAPKNEPDSEKTQPKKPYTTPTLVEYGDIAKLTQGSSGSLLDGMSAMMARMAMAMCL